MRQPDAEYPPAVLESEAPIPGLLLYALHAGGEVACHETMHGWIDPPEVVMMSVVPKGKALGWTLVRESSDTMLAAGMVHGQGYGSDMFKIMIHARQKGISPRVAINSAVNDAHARIDPHMEAINLVAAGVELNKTVDGDLYRLLIQQAEWEINYRNIYGYWPNSIEQKQEITPEEVPEPEYADPYSYIPQEGKYTLNIYTEEGFHVERFVDGERVEKTIYDLDGIRVERITYNEDGYTVEKFVDGELVEGEVWIWVNKDKKDEEPRYEKKISINTSILTKSGEIYKLKEPRIIERMGEIYRN